MKRLRVISRDNGVGLSRDLRLIADILGARDIGVETVGFGANRMRNRMRELSLLYRRVIGGPVDTQVFIERVYARALPSARHNLLIPNPEWFLPKWTRYLPRFERVLCKTRHAMDIFGELGCATTYIGFTSEDRYQPDVPREAAFFHLAGRSSAKGTETLLAVWRRHPEWPRLTVVQSARKAKPGPAVANIDHRVGYLDDAELRRLQNAHRFHLCPSEFEGFGHYIAEGLSVGAVVIATDAAPMNELVTPERGLLVPCRHAEPHGLDVRHVVDAGDLEAAVERALGLDDAEQRRLGAAARRYFVESDRDFRERLVAAVTQLHE